MAKDRYDIFLSYVREETGGWTGILYRSLSDKLSTYQVFKDDEETTAGTKWAPRLERLVKRCRFFLLVVSKEWTTPRLQSLLADPNNWVRREILWAIEHNKHIIPVLVNGATPPSGLPANIQSAIYENQCFSFSAGTNKWDTEVDKLCTQITGEARGGKRSDTITRLFAPMDRHWETPCVRAAVNNGHAAFALCGSVEDDPLVFAQRCGTEINKDAGFEQAFDGPVSLKWKPFADNPNKSLRRQDLLQAIAEGSALNGGANVELDLKSHFRSNDQTLVFFAVASGVASLTEARIAEWLGVWEDLLASGQKGSVVALVFAPRGRLLAWRPRLPAPRSEEIDRLQRKGLGVIESDDVDLFVEDLSKDGKLSDPQKGRVERVKRRLFILPFGRRFKKVKDNLAPILTT